MCMGVLSKCKKSRKQTQYDSLKNVSIYGHTLTSPIPLQPLLHRQNVSAQAHILKSVVKQLFTTFCTEENFIAGNLFSVKPF